MDMFLYIIGTFSIIVGVVILKNAPTALQEISGLLSIGFGSVVFGLGGVVAAIKGVSSLLKARLKKGESDSD